jgi:beta-glucosidase
VPCGGSQALLSDLLRGELGFDGVVVADYFTVDTLHAYHRFATGKGDAARRALEAGLDVELPAIDCFGAPLRDALNRGAVPVALVDRAVRRLLRIKLELGLFERPFVDAAAAPLVFDTAPQRALARELGRKSIVLLRNEHGLLPLPKTLRRLAVIGPSASSIRVLQGDYHYPSHLEIVFGAIGEHAPMPGPVPGRQRIDLGAHFPRMVSLLDGIRAAVSPATAVVVERGCDLLDPNEDGIPSAVDAAREADSAIVCVGGKSGLVDGCTSGESVDRCTLGLPGAQQALVEAITPPTRPWSCWSTRSLAIRGSPKRRRRAPRMAPGREGGHAVADVLFGDDPGGRCRCRCHGASASSRLLRPQAVGRALALERHLRDGPVTLFLGTGSPTRFAYANRRCHVTWPVWTSSRWVQVTNVAGRAGEEGTALRRDVVGSVTRLVQELRVVRVALAPGNRRVVFALAVRALAFRDVPATRGGAGDDRGDGRCSSDDLRPHALRSPRDHRRRPRRRLHDPRPTERPATPLMSHPSPTVSTWTSVCANSSSSCHGTSRASPAERLYG